MVDAKAIYRNITELILACETVRHAGKCSVCPLMDDCLEDCTFDHIAYKVKTEAIQKMIYLADDITEEEEERSKTDEERKWEAEADYWNDRRGDLDYE